MKAQETNLKDAYVITTPRFDDERGFFLESFSLQRFRDVTGAMDDFVQDNHSKFTEKGNKAAATRARKAVGELKKLVTEYRKASVTESKRTV